MNPFGAPIAIAIVYLAWPALRDWWRTRSDSAVDASHTRLCDALRSECGRVDVPPFRVIVGDLKPFDWSEDGAA